jgi:hypothetical protein
MAHPFEDGSLSGRDGLRSAWGAGKSRGRKMTFDRVATEELANTEPSPRMARKPTMSSWRLVK